MLTKIRKNFRQHFSIRSSSKCNANFFTLHATDFGLAMTRCTRNFGNSGKEVVPVQGAHQSGAEVASPQRIAPL
jgi:hypothetical protein